MRCRLFKTASPWLLLNIIVWSPEKSSTCKASFQEKGTGRRLLACGRPERRGPRKAGCPAAPSALVPEVLAAHVRPCRAPHICILLRRSESHGGTRGHTCCGRPGPRQWMLFLSSSFFFLIKKKKISWLHIIKKNNIVFRGSYLSTPKYPVSSGWAARTNRNLFLPLADFISQS